MQKYFIEGYWTDSVSSQYSQVRYKSNNFIFFNWKKICSTIRGVGTDSGYNRRLQRETTEEC
jgi:hypothetical protein